MIILFATASYWNDESHMMPRKFASVFLFGFNAQIQPYVREPKGTDLEVSTDYFSVGRFGSSFARLRICVRFICPTRNNEVKLPRVYLNFNRCMLLDLGTFTIAHAIINSCQMFDFITYQYQ